MYEYLIKAFGFNEPIFISDIIFKNYSKVWISKELKKLCESEKIVRYERGIYYIPKNTVFGKSSLNPNKVIKRKYLSDKGNSIGFYTGITALQQIGLSTQMSNVPEIQTNNENSKLRRVKVGNQQLILRKSRVQINNQNIDVLKFLEIMTNVNASYLNDERKLILKQWIERNNISRQLVTEYAPLFPDKAMRNLIESGVIYYVA